MHEWKYALENRPQIVANELGELSLDKEEPTENLITWIFDEGSFIPSAKITKEDTFSIISDHLGTPVLAYNGVGNQVWKRELDIFGNVRVGDNIFVPFLYQGQYYDNETELAYNRFRYYSPESGMYVSQDPIGLSGGSKLYSYVGDSNKLIDILGLESGTITVLLQAGGKHFGVVTKGAGGMMTDLNQLGDLGIGSNEDALIAKNSDLYAFDKYIDIDVDDIDAAKKMQLDEVSRGSFKYHALYDSCLTHVANVLKAAGINIPVIDPNSSVTDKRKAFIGMKKYMEGLKDWECI